MQLDQRFLTELARTAALFQSLFETSGRKELLKVCNNTSLVAGLLLRPAGRQPSVATWLCHSKQEQRTPHAGTLKG